MYYQNILRRQSDEIVKKVFVAQQKSPRKEDWLELVREDMKKYNINVSEEKIIAMSEVDFKIIIRKHIKQPDV